MRVVNKERALHGESVEASPSSINDMSAGRRGGLRSHQGPGGRTLLQLRNEARQRGLKGRSAMNKGPSSGHPLGCGPSSGPGRVLDSHSVAAFVDVLFLVDRANHQSERRAKPVIR